MSERLRNGQVIGVVTGENPDKDINFKIETARVINYRKPVKVSYIDHPETVVPISKLKGCGIQYTFPQLSPYLR